MRLLAIAILLTTCSASYSLTFKITKDSDIVGILQTASVQKRESLSDIARRFDIGITELIEANPRINPRNVKAGTVLVIPTQFILPKPRHGIVINLAEFRLYYFSKQGDTVSTHPIGIGRVGWRTPIGETKVVRKRENPTWIPPQSIRNLYARNGKILPASIPPGPDNPLGTHALNLAWPRYVIHGTNKPTSVGLRSSSGCMRMYPEDIQSLYHKVNVDTVVTVIHEPFKVGKKDQELYLEAHEPFPEPYYHDEDEETLLREIIDGFYNRYKQRIDWSYADQNLEHSVGYPIKISN